MLFFLVQVKRRQKDEADRKVFGAMLFQNFSEFHIPNQAILCQDN
jgi:hypothetical protein